MTIAITTIRIKPIVHINNPPKPIFFLVKYNAIIYLKLIFLNFYSKQLESKLGFGNTHCVAFL